MRVDFTGFCEGTDRRQLQNGQAGSSPAGFAVAGYPEASSEAMEGPEWWAV